MRSKSPESMSEIKKYIEDYYLQKKRDRSDSLTRFGLYCVGL